MILIIGALIFIGIILVTNWFEAIIKAGVVCNISGCQINSNPLIISVVRGFPTGFV
jgi:hypothetical protein